MADPGDKPREPVAEYIEKKDPFYRLTVNVPEASADGKDSRQGSYTLEDYLAIPDDRRVELLDEQLGAKT